MAAEQPGAICTFYSYKGGVGRSMCVANVAVLLAQWGRKVLLIDWDLEAPGLERYLHNYVPDARGRSDGIVELFEAFTSGKTLDWHKGLLSVNIPKAERIDLLHAGRDNERYLDRLRKIDWNAEGLAQYLEQLRSEWKREYNFILIDSRTGLTDIGGICAIHLPDYLVSLFTTTQQSLMGVRNTMMRARTAHADMAFDRKKLMIIPIPARDESNTEYKLAAEWRKSFADALAPFYEDWIPKQEDAERALNVLKIPYVAFWSFGEQLPVVKEDAANTKTLAYSYTLIARLLNSKLDWAEVVHGRQSAEAEAEQQLKTERQVAEAAKLREEAQLLQQQRVEQQAEAERKEVDRVKSVAFDRLERLRTELEFKRVRAGVAWCVFAGGAALLALLGVLCYIPSTQRMIVDLLNFQAPAATIILSAFAFAGAYVVGVGAFIKQRRIRAFERKLTALERERTAFEAGTGRYDLQAGLAGVRLFLARIEDLAEASEDAEADAAAPETPGASPGTAGPSTRDSETVTRGPGRIASAPSSGGGAPASAVAAEARLDPNAPVDLLLVYTRAGVTPAWMQEFMPLLRTWLGEELGRDPVVVDASAASVGNVEGGATLERSMVARAGVAAVILTKRFLSSEWGRRQLELLGDLIREGRVVPITLDRGLELRGLSGLESVRVTDFSDLALLGEGFTKTERYVEFQQRIRELANRMARLIESRGGTASPGLEVAAQTESQPDAIRPNS